VRYESFDKAAGTRSALRVSDNGLMGWIDDKQIVGVETKRPQDFDPLEVELSRPLGVSCFATVAGLKDIQIAICLPKKRRAPSLLPEVIACVGCGRWQRPPQGWAANVAITLRVMSRTSAQ